MTTHFANGGFYSIRTNEYYDKYLNEIGSASDTEVGGADQPSKSWTFSDAKPLKTFVALRSSTESLIRSDWTHLLTNAETTEWLTDYSTEIEGKQISSLTAEVSENWKWGTIQAEQISSTLEDSRLEMPWYRHNQHLTLLVNCSDNTSSAMDRFQGIYFRRAAKSKFIAPVQIFGSDCIEILLMFITYTRRIVEWGKFREMADVESVCPNIDSIFEQLQHQPAILDQRNRSQRLESALSHLNREVTKSRRKRESGL